MIFAILMSVALQAPPAPKAEPVPPPAVAPKPVAPAPTAPPKPETLDEQIKRALTHHPDIRVARLQVEVAQAKLEQERQRLTQRITAIRAARAAAVASRDKMVQLLELRKNIPGITTQAERLEAEAHLVKAQSLVAAMEAELQAAVGGPPASRACPAFDHATGPFTNARCSACHAADPRVYSGVYEVQWNQGLVQHGTRDYVTLAWDARAAKPEVPAAPDDFRTNLARMLDERITPAKKEGSARNLIDELFTKAAGGKPLPVIRLPMRLDEKMWKDVGKYTLQGETETFGAWLQQLTDAVSGGVRLPGEPVTTYTLYVRDYGLLLAPAAEAPAGAVTVAEFWQRARAEKAAREKATEKPAPAK